MTHHVCAQAGHRLEIDMTKPCPYCERDKLLLRISLLEHKLAAAEADAAMLNWLIASDEHLQAVALGTYERDAEWISFDAASIKKDIAEGMAKTRPPAGGSEGL